MPRFCCWYKSSVVAIICIPLTVGVGVGLLGGSPNPWEDDDRIFAEQRAAEKDAMKPDNQLISELRGLRIAAERIAAALEKE